MVKIITSWSEELKTQQSLVIWDLCLRKTRSENSHDYRDGMVFGKPRFLKADVFEYLRFEERLEKSSVFVTG